MFRPLVICMGLLLVPALAIAHGKATCIVKERMDQMVTLKDAMKMLKDELASGGDYDVPRVIEAARIVERHSGAAMTDKFPEGSTQHSEALPSIWTDPDRFAELAGELESYAAAMASAAQNGATAPADRGILGIFSATPSPEELSRLHPFEAFKAAADVCSACHREFRMKGT